MLFLVLNLLLAAVAAQKIAYFPPPNSVDDYIRLDMSNGGSPIREVTIAAWGKQADPNETHGGADGYFFSFATRSVDNMLLLGGNKDYCIRFWVSGKDQKSSSCSSYSVSVGTSNTCFTIIAVVFFYPASVCTYCVLS